MIRYSIFTGCLLLFAIHSFSQQESVQSDKQFGSKLPVTYLRFNNDTNLVQFAILSDRTGGMVPGIFEDAVKKANQLQPQFVMSVGDLINGYSTDSVLIDTQWKEFNQLLEPLTVPFFYVSGNHDISNSWMQQEWIRRYGQSHYYFIYRNTLFLCLNSQDNGSYGMSESQISYFRTILQEHQNVRWTFVFMHQPMWTSDKSGFEKIEDALEGRKFTIFAGHTHNYLLSKRNNQKYYILATSGGGSERRGEQFGEFDHITWVTLKDTEEPIVAHIKLDGIIDENIVTEEIAQKIRPLKSGSWMQPIAYRHSANNTTEITPTIHLKNTNQTPLSISGHLPNSQHFKSIPERIDTILAPGESINYSFKIQHKTKPAFKLMDLPPIEIELQASQELDNRTYSLPSKKRLYVDWPYSLAVNEMIRLDHPEQVIEDWDWSGTEDLDLRFTLREDDNYLHLKYFIKDDNFIFQAGDYQDQLLIYLEDKNQEKLLLTIYPDPKQTKNFKFTTLDGHQVKIKPLISCKLNNGELTVTVKLPKKVFLKADGTYRLNVGYMDQDDPTSTEAAILFWKPKWDSKENYPGSGTWAK
ncbi:MAG: metallophosphoesterase [Flavipsychrobacter sp.]|nr:metallophosphoesterase [Flavipsychrobacter sp.]